MHQRYSTGIHGPDWITILAGGRNGLLISLVAMGLMLSGCASPGALPDGAQPVAGAAPDTAAPSLAAMEAVLSAELVRLGKTTMAAGEYVPPSGAMNIPFDLHAQVIDPDGEGGADPLGVHVSWTERLVGDYNMDGLVNASDLTPLGQYYNQTVEYRDPASVSGVEWWPEDTSYHILNSSAPRPWRLARIDGNGDGLINMQDITPIGQHWQERITQYGFMIKRNGGVSEVVTEPGSSSIPYYIEHGSSPLKGILGENWLDTPLMYEVNLPVSIEPGDVVSVVPICTATGDLTYDAECDIGKPPWYFTGPIFFGSRCLLGARVVRLYDGKDIQGILVSAPEYFRGDLDGNGACHAIESSLLEPYFGRATDSFNEPDWFYADRLDWDRDGFLSTSDLTPIATNVQQRLDGITFCLRDSYPDTIPIMNPDNPARRLVVPRPFTTESPIDHVYRCLLPDQPGEDELGICVISCDTPDSSIADPEYYPIQSGVSSSLPEDGEPLIAVLAAEFNSWTNNMQFSCDASYSTAGKITDYEWDADNDGVYEITGETYINVDQSPGEHIVRLRVTDDQSNSAEVELTVTIAE